MELIQNSVSGKDIYLKTFGNVALNSEFEAKIVNNNGRITIDSDLPGLKK